MAYQRQFVHLHNHSHFSMLDGHALVFDMAKEAARLGQPAIALTDHGNMHAVYELQVACEQEGIEPIFGIEAYMAPTTTTRHGRERVFYGRSDSDKEEGSDDVSGGGTYTHITLLARSDEGLRNLFGFVTKTFTEGYYRKNRGDLELLDQYGKGIIATTGCPSGEVQTRIRLGQYDKALEYAAQVRDIVGKENYFLELMDHGMTIDLERRVLPELLRLAKELNIPLLATNDSHYVREEDAIAHEHLLAMQTRSVMSEKTYDEGGRRFAFNGKGYYLKSYEEMARLFPEDRFPGALSNTLLVAEMTKGTRLRYDDDLRPKIDIPEGHTVETYLIKEAYAGLARRRGGEDKITEEDRARIEMELSVVLPKNFGDYFLVTSDFVRWAKQQGIEVGPGRGSVAGSLLAYALDITEADPLKHGLLFERFLNPERSSPPDADLDFEDTRRALVVDYVTQKYGHDNVSNIATFTKIGVKTGIKDAAKILGEPYSTGDILSKKMPAAEFGKEMTFKQLFDPTEERYEEAGEFRAAVKELNAEEVIKVARSVEGRVKTSGVHAAGIIISSKPLQEHIPMMMRQSDGAMITQLDYPTCETLGLIKFDFLGLRNLSIIRQALDDIERIHGVSMSVREIVNGPMDDPKTYELMQRGDTLGVFQLDGGPMRELLKRMNPTSIDDITAVLALYRPGPMGMNSHNEYADRKNGRAPISYPHPELEEPLKDILGPTYGVATYQEQIMEIAQRVAGYSLAQADNLRRAMGKKKKEVLEAEYVPFRDGARANGFSDEAIQALWEVLVPFSAYGFNKSHGLCYAMISYVTAFLKANYPAEYMSALLTSVFDDKDTVSLYLQECKRMGLSVLGPDVNHARVAATPVDNRTIVFGLSGVAGISAHTAELIIKAREDQGEFTSVHDFMKKVPSEVLNKSVIEGLVQSGAFDAFGHSRRAVLTVAPDMIKEYRARKKQEDKGQESLFDMLLDMDAEEESSALTEPAPIPDIPEFPKQELLSAERKVLGLYLSDHPLSGLADTLAAASDTSIIDILTGQVPSVTGFASRDTPRRSIAGVVVGIVYKYTKKGDRFAIVTLEDLTGTIEATMFSRTLQEYGDILKNDHVYTFVGVPRIREEGATPSFTVDSIAEIEVTDDGRSPVSLRLHEEQVTEDSLGALRDVLRRHPGKSPVRVGVRTKSGDVTTFQLPEDLAVTPSALLSSEVRALFGHAALGRW